MAFLGSNLGNTTPAERTALLAEIAATRRPGDGLLVPPASVPGRHGRPRVRLGHPVDPRGVAVRDRPARPRAVHAVARRPAAAAVRRGGTRRPPRAGLPRRSHPRT
ncbi:L-histidine N(alpha)-methyltransferase [Pseudonocardia bannensis]|uniref:L-histidine N(Alpha)-methyltransferase n=1 Tax=Pseudonocardia bannensis TaxID=630973 RepID=A0A848DD49_9PSEU|nr:L-histidine N(alpha)-methyltransferase [Pseudonocardia bannensis]